MYFSPEGPGGDAALENVEMEERISVIVLAQCAPHTHAICLRIALQLGEDTGPTGQGGRHQGRERRAERESDDRIHWKNDAV